MKVRTLVAGCLVLTGAATVAPASATPYAGQNDYLYAQTTVRTAGGVSWDLTIVATQAGALESRVEQRLYIDLDRCTGSGCVPVGRWSKPLAVNEITVADDLTTGRLRTTLFGKPLAVTLTGGTGPFDEVGFYVGGAGVVVGGAQSGAAPDAGRERSATGPIVVGGATCSALDALLVQQVVVDNIGDDVKDPRKAPPAQAPRGFSTRGCR